MYYKVINRYITIFNIHIVLFIYLVIKSLDAQKIQKYTLFSRFIIHKDTFATILSTFCSKIVYYKFSNIFQFSLESRSFSQYETLLNTRPVQAIIAPE